MPSPQRRPALVCKPVPVKIAALADGVKTRTFQLVAYTGEAMNLYPWPHPVVVDLATIDTSALVPALYDHCPDVDFVVGQVAGLKVTGGQLIAEGQFTPPGTDTPPERNYCKKVLDRADAGYQWQVSIGGDPASVENVAAGQTAVVNGRDYPGPVCVARGVVLREISFVVLGGDRRTSAVVARNGKGKLMAASFEDWLGTTATIFGADPGKLDETQMAAAKLLYESQSGGTAGDAVAADATPPDDNPPADPNAADATPPKDEPPTNAAAKKPALKARKGNPVNDHVAALRAETAAELKRQKDVTALAAAHGNPEVETTHADGTKEKVPFSIHAIGSGLSLTAAKAELLDIKRDRPTGPMVVVSSRDKSHSLQSLQGAMVLRAGGKLDHKAYKTMGGQALLGKVAPWMLRDINDADRNRYMEAAHQLSNMSMIDLCREACRLNGIDTPHDRDDLIRAAFSGGGNLTNVFTTNVNAILLSSYVENSNDTTAGWVSEADVNDFKTNERPRVQIGDGLKKLPRGAEAEHASYTDLVESYKIARYAKQFQIDEQDIIDDNFGVFADTPRQFGMAAARLRPDLVYGAVILANPTLSATAVALFSDTNDNLQGSGTLAHGTLSSGLSMMRLFRENSQNLNLMATHMLVPPTLEDLAIELTMSTNIQAVGTAGAVTIRGESNSLSKRGLQVVAESRLENGVVNPADESSQSGSASAWFLICADAHTIEVGYLKGTGRAPKVRATVLDKGKWGMNWDVNMDIGVKALDWKGFVKST